MSDVVRAVIAGVLPLPVLVWSLSEEQKNGCYVGYKRHNYAEICRLWNTYFACFMSFIDGKCLSLCQKS